MIENLKNYNTKGFETSASQDNIKITKPKVRSFLLNIIKNKVKRILH